MLRELHKRYGPVVRIGPNEASIADWTVYRDIYSQRGSLKTKTFYSDTKLAGHDNIFTFQSREEHSARRKMLNPSFSQQVIFENEGLIAERANILVKRMIKSAATSQSGSTAEVFRLNGLFSLEVIIKCAFNRDYGESPDGDSLALLRAMDSSAAAIQTSAALPFMTGSIGKLVRGRVGQSYKDWDLWQNTTAALLKDFEKHDAALDTTRRFMTSPLLTVEDNLLARKLTQEEVIEEQMGITFAGSGTTSNTLTYLIYALSRDSKLQDRLREELQRVGEGLSQIKGLLLLNAIIKETMRLYPTIISTLPHVLERPLVVGKHLLPAGTFVGMQNHVHHRDHNVFPDPGTFWADRWLLGDAETKDMNASLTPFSFGPRNCIGKNLAMAELYLASKIFRRLRLTLNHETTEVDMEMEDRFNLAPKGKHLLVDVEVLN